MINTETSSAGFAEMEENVSSSADAPGGSPDALKAVEERIKRLEDALAALQDTRQLEEKIVDRLTKRTEPKPAESVRKKAGKLADAGRRLLPAAVSGLLLSSVSAEEKADAGAPEATSSPIPLPRSWLLVEAYHEFLAMVRMFFDPRYRVSWHAWVIPTSALGLMAFSWFFIGYIPFLGTVLDKVIDLILAFVIYKVLIHEANQYRETIASLPPSSKS